MMLSLAQFEQLISVHIPPKPMPLASTGQKGEYTETWLNALMQLNRQEQYKQLHAMLSELIVADIRDQVRLEILDKISLSIERFAVNARNDYIYSQSPTADQLTHTNQVRSLYYLAILAYQGVANRAYVHFTDNPFVATPKASGNKLSNWLGKLGSSLNGNVVRNGVSLEMVGGKKREFVHAVYRIMTAYFQLLMEFALTYERTPKRFWQEMNSWYLKTATEGVDKVEVAKFTKQPSDHSIYDSYIKACMASFTNMFAFRRQDILNVFRILPKWAKFLSTSFVSNTKHRVFVNLQDTLAPEVITPQASINPYSKDAVCLFFDFAPLFERLKQLEHQDPKTASQATLFESRLAKMVLLTFDRQSEIESGRTRQHHADLLVGFEAIFKELSDHKSFNQIIQQSKLDASFHPKSSAKLGEARPKAMVKMIAKSQTAVRFFYEYPEVMAPRTQPFLQVFGLFALRSHSSNNSHPWRVGVIQWVDHEGSMINLDGLFLGRVLSVCGIRLVTSDMRSKDFVPAILLSGDGLSEQSTLITPRYHFKVGDTVILRIHSKEITLRLEESLMITDDMEQYRIARLIT